MLAKPYDPSVVVERIRLLRAKAGQRPSK